MGRTLEAIFRRPVRLLMLIVLLPVISVALTYFVVPRTYQSTAALWALRPYETIGTTSVGIDQLTTPAQTQATALSELLQSRTFALTVAHENDIASTLDLAPNVRSDPQLLDDALFDEISHNVVVEAQGDSLFKVSYVNRDPQVAREIVLAVIKNYGLQSVALSVSVDQHLLVSYQKQLAIARKNANAAVTAESAYLQAHPELTQNLNLTPSQLLTDPHYALLDQLRVQAQSVLQNIASNIVMLNQTISLQDMSPDSLYKVLDAPKVASRPVSRLRQYLIAGGVGLGVAILTCALYIVVLVRRDRGVHTIGDLEQVTALPVMLQLPYVKTATMSLVMKESVYSGAILGRGRDRANER